MFIVFAVVVDITPCCCCFFIVIVFLAIETTPEPISHCGQCAAQGGGLHQGEELMQTAGFLRLLTFLLIGIS